MASQQLSTRFVYSWLLVTWFSMILIGITYAAFQLLYHPSFVNALCERPFFCCPYHAWIWCIAPPHSASPHHLTFTRWLLAPQYTGLHILLNLLFILFRFRISLLMTISASMMLHDVHLHVSLLMNLLTIVGVVLSIVDHLSQHLWLGLAFQV